MGDGEITAQWRALGMKERAATSLGRAGIAPNAARFILDAEFLRMPNVGMLALAVIRSVAPGRSDAEVVRHISSTALLAEVARRMGVSLHPASVVPVSESGLSVGDIEAAIMAELPNAP